MATGTGTITLRITDELISAWRSSTSPHDRCPLATAFKDWLLERGTPESRLWMLNANSTDGSIYYEIGNYAYKSYPVEQDKLGARKFIRTVDFEKDKLPRKRVFHYTTPQQVHTGGN